MNEDRSVQDCAESDRRNDDARMGEFSEENLNKETETCAGPLESLDEEAEVRLCIVYS